MFHSWRPAKFLKYSAFENHALIHCVHRTRGRVCATRVPYAGVLRGQPQLLTGTGQP
jgi:hypothetical protein